MSERTLKLDKKIVNTAIALKVWKWDDSKNATDDLISDAAGRILDACEQAGARNHTGEKVLEILHVAGVEPTSSASLEAYRKLFNGSPVAPVPEAVDNGPTPEPPASDEAKGAFDQPQPAAPVTEEVAAEPVPAVQVNIDEIYPHYDDQPVGEITKAVLHFATTGELSPEEWEQIKAHESANQNRQEILSLQPSFPAPEQTPSERFEPGMPVHDYAPDPHNALEQSGTEFFAEGAKEAQPDPKPTEEYRPTPEQQADFEANAGPFTKAMFSKKTDSPAADEQDGDTVAAFYNGESISRAQQEGLPIPPQVGGEGTILPIDITAVSDQDLSRLSTDFTSKFMRTEWLISQETGREKAAEHLEQEAHRDAYIRAYDFHKNEIPEDKRGPTALDSARKLADRDADDAQAVRHFRSKKVRHAIDVGELKALAKGFDKSVWRISEELGRRERLTTTSHATK